MLLTCVAIIIDLMVIIHLFSSSKFSSDVTQFIEINYVTAAERGKSTKQINYGLSWDILYDFQ